MLIKPDEALLWDEETGIAFTLLPDQRIWMVMEGTIVWCEIHQCFHYTAHGAFAAEGNIRRN